MQCNAFSIQWAMLAAADDDGRPAPRSSLAQDMQNKRLQTLENRGTTRADICWRPAYVDTSTPVEATEAFSRRLRTMDDDTPTPDTSQMIPEGSQDRLGSRENTHVDQKSCKSSTFFNSLRLHPCLARVPLPNFCCLPVRAQPSPRTRRWQSKERMVVVDTEIRTFTHTRKGAAVRTIP